MNEIVLVTLKKKWKGSSISPQLHKGFSIMFLSRDGGVRYYSLFLVLHDRFVQDDFLENIVFGVDDIRIKLIGKAIHGAQFYCGL